MRELSSLQIAEWLAYHALEPFGWYAEWLRTGVVSAVIANAHSAKGKTYKPDAFMPKEPRLASAPVQSVEEQRTMLEKIYSWAKRMKKTKKDV